MNSASSTNDDEIVVKPEPTASTVAHNAVTALAATSRTPCALPSQLISQQQRQDQEPDGREAIGEQTERDGHRAPLPQSTTSTVCTRIARSNSRLRFFT